MIGELKKKNDEKSEDPNEYLNEDLFHSIISKYFISESFKVVNVRNTPATSAGQNFLTTVLRNSVSIQLSSGTRREFSFISKIIGSVMFDESTVDAMQVFPKEVESYRNIVPELEEIWKEVAGVEISFGPKIFYYELEPRKIIIFEDLNITGYKLGNKLNGLTEEEIFMVLKKISMWHAASRIYCDRRDSVNPMFQNGSFNSGSVDFYDSYYKLMYINFMETLRNAGIDDHHMESIEKWDGRLLSNILRVLKVDTNAFNCLNHGDLWINNLMLSNQNELNISTDLKFIDFQLGYYGSPVVELLYFLTMSVNHQLLTAQFDIFIAYYHRHLKKSLIQLNYDKIPTLKEIWIAMMDKSFYLTLTIIIALPNLLLDNVEHGIDITVLKQDSKIGYDMRKRIFGTPTVVTALKRFISFFGKRKMLDL